MSGDEREHVGVQQVECSLSEAWRGIETAHQGRAELVDIEDVSEGPTEVEHGLLELETLVEKDLRNPLLNPGSNRVEEDQHDECRHDDVQEQLLARHEAHQP